MRALTSITATSSRFVAGDPLRGLASFAVIVLHAAAAAAIVNGFPDGQHAALFGTEAARLMDVGLVAVPTFFVLSGYLLSRPFVRLFHAGTPTRFSLGDYAWRRIVRIVPAFWVVTLIAVLAFGDGSTVPQALAVFAFAQVYAPSPAAGAMLHGWTLDAEVFFYAGLPIAALAIAALAGGRRHRSLVALGAIVAIPAVGWAFSGLLHVEAASSAATPWGLLRAFLPGVLLAVAEVAWAPRLLGWSRGPRVAAVLFGVGLVLGAVGAFTSPPGELFILAATGIVGGPLLLQRSAGTAWWFLDNRPLHWLGHHSYGIYLAHWPLLLAVRPLFDELGPRPAFLAFLVTDVVLCCLAATLLWRFVEEPALRLRHRFAPARPPVPEPSDPVLVS